MMACFNIDFSLWSFGFLLKEGGCFYRDIIFIYIIFESVVVVAF
jgi:hypothetical protein